MKGRLEFKGHHTRKMSTKVGKLSYDPAKILGRGRCGTVFSGFHHVSDQKSTPVAVKRVEKSLVNESAIRKEEDLLKRASNHPNILKYIHTEMNAEFL